MTDWRARISLLLCMLLLAACAPKGGYRVKVEETPATKGLKGYQRPYSVNGERYEPLLNAEGYSEDGVASWYGPDFHGKPTSCGETYDMHAMTAAHKILPLGVYVRVTNRSNGRSTTVRVNDRGPFVKSRIIDLSYAAATELDVVRLGTAPVRIEVLGFRSGDGFVRPAQLSVGPFTIQVGSFRDLKNAERLASDLKNRFGVSTIQEGWVGRERFYRVRTGRYPTLDEARERQREMEKEFPACFTVAEN